MRGEQQQGGCHCNGNERFTLRAGIHPPHPLEGGIPEREIQNRCATPNVHAETPTSQPHEQRGNSSGEEKIHAGNDRLVWPHSQHGGIEEHDAWGFLVPSIKIRNIPGKKPLTGVGVQPLVSTGRLNESGQPKEEENDDDEPPQQSGS
jgi:hypothetical protein